MLFNSQISVSTRSQAYSVGPGSRRLGCTMRRGPGIAGLQNAARAKEQYRATGEEVKKSTLQAMHEQLTAFRTHLEEFAMKHRNDIRRDPVFRAQFHTMCANIGVDPLSSNKSLWAQVLGFGDYYYELGVQVREPGATWASHGCHGHGATQCRDPAGASHRVFRCGARLCCITYSLILPKAANNAPDPRKLCSHEIFTWGQATAIAVSGTMPGLCRGPIRGPSPAFVPQKGHQSPIWIFGSASITLDACDITQHAQVVEACMATRAINGGMIDLPSLLRHVNKRRGSQAEPASEDDVVRSIKKLRVLGGGFDLVSIGPKQYVRSVPGELNLDKNRALGVAQGKGYTSVPELVRVAGWPEQRAGDVLQGLTREGLAWVDDGAPDGVRLYWFPCLSGGLGGMDPADS